MLRVASALELWFEIVGLNSAVLGNQSRQSLSEQKIELSAQRNRPIEEGAILPPEVIPRPVEALQERRPRRDFSPPATKVPPDRRRYSSESLRASGQPRASLSSFRVSWCSGVRCAQRNSSCARYMPPRRSIVAGAGPSVVTDSTSRRACSATRCKNCVAGKRVCACARQTTR